MTELIGTRKIYYVDGGGSSMDEAKKYVEHVVENVMTKKISLSELESVIIDEQYYMFPGTTCTVCLLTTKNGTYVGGISQTVVGTFENYEGEGRKVAKEDAIRKLLSLEAYLIKNNLWEQSHLVKKDNS